MFAGTRKVVRVGCGAGFQGDRVAPAVELLKHGNLDFLVLECLAERTLVDSIERMRTGGKGSDVRLHEWMHALLPIAHANKVTIITNMGAADPEGAGKEASVIASSLGIPLRIATIMETEPIHPSSEGVACTYLGADAIIHALKEGAQLVIAGRVADPSLFVAPIVHTFGWDLKRDFSLIAQATLAGHLLECGCHLTGGYFAHPLGRNLGYESLSKLSLPFCDIDSTGYLVLGKLEGSGGELSERTCKQQLAYEINDPTAYITPDIIVDFSQVTFTPISPHAIVAGGAKATSRPKQLLRIVARSAGVKAWAEVSYGGKGCVQRAHWAAQLIKQWMEERRKGVMNRVMVYLVGHNSLYLTPGSFIPSSWNRADLVLENTDNNSDTTESPNSPEINSPPTTSSSPPPPTTTSSSPKCTCSCEGCKFREFDSGSPPEARLRFDGLFNHKEDAEALCIDIQALVLSGPAGGGGFNFGTRMDVAITKLFVDRELVKWRCMAIKTVGIKNKNGSHGNARSHVHHRNSKQMTDSNQSKPTLSISQLPPHLLPTSTFYNNHAVSYRVPPDWRPPVAPPQAPAGRVLMYDVAHSRSGDKGDVCNVSVIPYNPKDLPRLIRIVTPDWVKSIYGPLLRGKSPSVHVHVLPGPGALNVTLSPVLDGGVSVSRRIDRHGKTLSDLILNQWVDLPPLDASDAYPHSKL